MAGFPGAVRSCAIYSPFAVERSERRVILLERVLGSLSPQRIAFRAVTGTLAMAAQAVTPVRGADP